MREGVLIEGAAGWGEWSPFRSTRRRSPSPGCAAPRRPPPATGPSRCATAVPVNATVPVVSPEAAHALVARSGCATAKVKVADPGAPLADDLARVEAVRDALGSGGAGPRRRQRRVVRRRRRRRDRRARSGGRRPGVRRAAVCRRRGPGRRTPPGRRPDRRRRVDPPGRGPLPGARPRGRGHRGAQGPAARRGAGLPADRRGHRDAGRRLVRPRDIGRAGRRRRAGGGAARARACVRPRHPVTADGRRRRSGAGAGERRAASSAYPTVVPTALEAVAAPPDRVAWWEERLAAVRAVRQAGRS